MIEVLQRFIWNGTPKEIGDLFRVTKNRRKGGDLLPSIRLGSAAAGRLTRGARLIAGVPHPRGSAQHGRTVESRDGGER